MLQQPLFYSECHGPNQDHENQKDTNKKSNIQIQMRNKITSNFKIKIQYFMAILRKINQKQNWGNIHKMATYYLQKLLDSSLKLVLDY